MHTLTKALLPLYLLCLAVIPTSAEEKSFTLGGTAGWPSLSYTEAIAGGTGRLGREALVLSSMVSRSDGEDLYLSFDEPEFREATGNYTVVSSTLRAVGKAKARRGNGAALCNTDGTGLVLRGQRGSLFATPGESGSFSIDFWLLPAVTENGSVLLQWRSSRTASGGALYQYVRASLFHNHLEWTFSNIWTTALGKPMDVTIPGVKNLIPGVWSHHRLSWDSVTGLLEYSLDGSAEAIRYLTTSGRERGDVFPALFGAPADLDIGSKFSGLIDEFRIVRGYSEDASLEQRRANLDRYPSTGGRFVSIPIDSRAANSRLLRLSVVQNLPPETGTAFFVRSGDNVLQWTDTDPEWIPARSGESLADLTGRYFQIAGELYPDGLGQRTPVVTSVTLHYEEDSPPWPPNRVFTAPGDGNIVLSWVPSVDFDVAGYIVYYGERPGEYLASGSPLDAGKALSCVVGGLKNGKVYYFSVAAYDASGAEYPGALSFEVAERPRAARRTTAGGTGQ